MDPAVEELAFREVFKDYLVGRMQRIAGEAFLSDSPEQAVEEEIRSYLTGEGESMADRFLSLRLYLAGRLIEEGDVPAALAMLSDSVVNPVTAAEALQEIRDRVDDPEIKSRVTAGVALMFFRGHMPDEARAELQAELNNPDTPEEFRRMAEAKLAAMEDMNLRADKTTQLMPPGISEIPGVEVEQVAKVWAARLDQDQGFAAARKMVRQLAEAGEGYYADRLSRHLVQVQIDNANEPLPWTSWKLEDRPNLSEAEQAERVAERLDCARYAGAVRARAKMLTDAGRADEAVKLLRESVAPMAEGLLRKALVEDLENLCQSLGLPDYLAK